MRIVVNPYTTDGEDVERDEFPENYDWEELEDGEGWATEVETIEELHTLLTGFDQSVALEANEPSAEGDPAHFYLTLDPDAD